MPDTNQSVVDNLVTQFSNPLHCFRELVQNSIDAGSSVVEVWTEYIESDGHKGTIALHVDDYGEGMDETIIDEEFTRLFASSKEKDLTKIGQFGIGFVSTFALDPEAILVETGRSGEYWEVLFHEDRSYTKTELDVPVEGTQITIFLEGDVHRYRQLTGDIEQTLRHWCNHSDTRVTFEDRTPQSPSDSSNSRLSEPVTINEPFDVPGTCTATTDHEGTEIVVAYSDKPIYGFYNRGLTLELTDTGDDVLGDRVERYEHIAFKIKSRYLEHTLSRETVMRDENFEKAMNLLNEAVRGPLFDNLIDELDRLATMPNWSVDQLARYGKLLTFLSKEPAEQIASVGDRDLLRTVDGKPLSLDEVFETWKTDGRVLIADEPTELTERLRRQGVPVVLGATDDLGRDHLGAVRPLLTTFIFQRHESSLLNRFRRFALSADLQQEAKSAVSSPDEVYLPVVVDQEPPEAIAPLLEATRDLLDSVGIVYDEFGTCTVGSSEGGDAPLFVTGRELGPTMSRPPDHLPADHASPDQHTRRPAAAINREHPQFLEAAELFDHSPAVAAYCLAKSAMLGGDIPPRLDAKLLDQAVDHALDPANAPTD